MKSLLNWIYNFATAIGGPGLFLIAFLDSSFLSFPQANDLLIVVMVAKAPQWMPYYAGLATLGSLAGCLAIYYVARKGGEAFLRKRMSGPPRGMGRQPVQAVWRPGDPGALHPPTAGPVQALRAGRRRRADARLDVRALDPRWAGRALLRHRPAHGLVWRAGHPLPGGERPNGCPRRGRRRGPRPWSPTS